MVMREVCDAWIAELQFSVTALSGATVHRYASWSSNAIADTTPGIHLAVWPDGDPDARRSLTTDGADEVTTSYTIAVWEGATPETERVFDDDASNGHWVDLFEAVKDRVYTRGNIAIGDPGSTTKYQGGALEQAGNKRLFRVKFNKKRYETLR